MKGGKGDVPNGRRDLTTGATKKKNPRAFAFLSREEKENKGQSEIKKDLTTEKTHIQEDRELYGSAWDGPSPPHVRSKGFLSRRIGLPRV